MFLIVASNTSTIDVGSIGFNPLNQVYVFNILMRGLSLKSLITLF